MEATGSSLKDAHDNAMALCRASTGSDDIRSEEMESSREIDELLGTIEDDASQQEVTIADSRSRVSNELVNSSNGATAEPPPLPSSKETNDNFTESKQPPNKEEKRSTDKNLKDSPKEERPLQLRHRLFASVEKKKRGRPRKTATPEGGSPRKQRRAQETTEAATPQRNEDMIDWGSVVLRGSITHAVMQKLGREINPELVMDDSLEGGAMKLDDAENEQLELNQAGDIGTGAIASENKAAVACTKPDRVDDLTSTLSMKEDAEIETEKPQSSGLRLCFRSTVMPQMSTRTPKERHRVVILQGPNKGQTGTIRASQGSHFTYCHVFVIFFLTVIASQVSSRTRSTASRLL